MKEKSSYFDAGRYDIHVCLLHQPNNSTCSVCVKDIVFILFLLLFAPPTDLN